MRIATALILVGLCGCLHAQQEKQPEAEPADEQAVFVAVPAKGIVIDGRLDETCWLQATAAGGDYINGKTGVASETPRATVRYAWDNDYLYIGYETFDSNLKAVASGDIQGPKDNQRPGCEIWGPDDDRPDVVEFFISVDDPLYMWELHHNAENGFNDVWCAVIPDDRPYRQSIETPWGIRFCSGEYLKDDGDKTFRSAVALKPKADGTPSTVNQAGDLDTGYTAELRIPWRSLEVPKAWGFWADDEGKPVDHRFSGDRFWVWRPEGKTIRLLMVVQDSDLKTRYHHTSPTMPGGWFHHNFQYWPEYTLVPRGGMALR